MFYLEIFKIAEMTFNINDLHRHSRSLLIQRQSTYCILLVIHCNYVDILHRFRDVVINFMKQVTQDYWKCHPLLDRPDFLPETSKISYTYFLDKSS